jgi:tetratricopeptide (TPR) repeat protein
MSISPSTDVSNYLAAAQQLIQKGELAKALETLDSLPKEAQATTSTRYMRGVCYRHMKNFGSAEALFRQILEDEPSHSRAFQELGHLYRDADMPVEALNSYATACHLNPALKASWLGQKKLLSAMSQPERLTQVQQRLDWLEALPPNLVASWDLLHEGRLHKAEQLCRQFMQQHPRHIDGMRILAEIAVRHGVLEDAEFLLESAVTFEPNHRQARID